MNKKRLTFVFNDPEERDQGFFIFEDFLTLRCRDGSPLAYFNGERSLVEFKYFPSTDGEDEEEEEVKYPTNCMRCDAKLRGDYEDGSLSLGAAPHLGGLREELALCQTCAREFKMAYRGFMKGRKNATV